MRLISCNINGFGGLKGAAFDFNEGITAICEENGFGKSTLADFIKAMLYGLPTSKRGGRFDDRTHYCPLGGGAFGGSLKIEVGGKIYRIERDFDGKSETRDVLRFMDENGENLPVPEEGIGEWLFGVDEESFIRTAYISRDGINAEATPSIGRKLNDLVDGETGEENYESAVKNLTRAYKEIRADRGREGAYYAAVDEKAECEVEAASLRNIDSFLGERYHRLNAMAAEIKKETELYNLSVHEKTVKSYFERYDAFLSDADKKREELAQILSKYPSGLPIKADFLSVKETYRKQSETESRLMALSAAGKALPDSAKLNEIGRRCNECAEIEKKVASLKKPVKGGGEKKGIPVALIVVLFVLGAIAACAGVALYFIFNQPYAFIACGAGAAAIIIAIILSAVRKADKDRLSRLKEATTQLNQSEKSLKELFSAYSAYAGDIPSSLACLTDKVKVYNAEKTRVEGDLSAYSRNVTSFYSKYSIRRSTSFWDDMAVVEADISRSEILSGEIAALVDEADSYKLAKNLTSRPTGEDESALHEENLKRLRAEYAALGAEISSDERALSALPALEEKISALSGRSEELNARYLLIKRTLSYLEEAEGNLRKKYISPIMDVFSEYASFMSPETFDAAHMNFEYRLTFEKDGIMRGEEYFSSGQRRCIELCLRLALVKNMYRAESPFVIMDDPFSLLDDRNIERAAEILRKAAKDMQIIYFCPHHSRMI